MVSNVKMVSLPGSNSLPASLVTEPSLVEWKGLRFLIMDAPKPNNLHLYVKECKKRNVVSMVRVCEPTYAASEVQAAGIHLHEMEYDDGSAPPETVITRWLEVVQSSFKRGSSPPEEQGPCVAVHCVAGLGRAPVLVALALIENGMDPISAVEYIRARRRGAINMRQLRYLESYQRRHRNGCANCLIM
jgi:protein tyrosine phosphatase type 4A